MSDPLPLDRPTDFDYPPSIQVVCPKCGQTSAFPLAASRRNVVRYVGVCNASYAPGMWCDASLNIEVSSHLLATGL